MKAFEDQLKAMDEEKTRLEKTVKDNLNTYAVPSEKKRVMEKARIALELGLGEKALQVLLDSDSLEFGKEGAVMELALLMQQGRLDELREQLAPEKEDIRKQLPEDMNSSMGQGTYETYRTLLAVAEGDYKEADASLEQAEAKAVADPERLRGLRVARWAWGTRSRGRRRIGACGSCWPSGRPGSSRTKCPSPGRRRSCCSAGSCTASRWGSCWR